MKLVLSAAVLALAPALSAQQARPSVDKLNLEKGNLAIAGYDPVAYFPEGGGEPTEGKKELALTYRGVTYRFANEANRERFLATPVKYEPAYGGWCAWAMADDDRVEVDPKSFLVQDGELLLFYDGFWADTRKSWSKGDGDALKRKADANWAKHYGAPERDLSRLNLDGDVGLGGFDPVSVRAGKPVAGDAQHRTKYRGVTYRFANDANRKAFLKDPAGHEPRLGGWDANALLKGERAPGKAEHGLVHDGRLYLFSSDASRSAFAARAAELVAEAEAKFQSS